MGQAASIPLRRAMIYARYSSDLQRDQSIEDQVRICSARAEREGWHIAEVFSDAATSGSTLLRPGYQLLLTAIREHKVDTIIAESLDRFSRDLEHIAAFYKQCVFYQIRLVTLSEGEITDLHVGLKGTMGALYLKDLADKTRRGLEGRVQAGRCVSAPPYGYVVLRKLDDRGELDRGLRAIDPEKALIVQRIFEAYGSGSSPRQIAKKLNAEGVPGPAGGRWYEDTIRGRAKRGDGILRNELYIGRIVWRRRTNAKDPVSGALVRRDAERGTYVVKSIPEMRILDDSLWDKVQARLLQEAVPKSQPSIAFWDRRRPRHLLSGKVECGVCGRTFSATGRDYLGCKDGLNGSCTNKRNVRRTTLEAHVLQLLAKQLMQPDLVEEFIATFKREWQRLQKQYQTQRATHLRDQAALDRKIANVVDVISEGRSSPALLAKLAELERQRGAMGEVPDNPLDTAPVLHPRIAEAYAARIDRLTAALAKGDNPEALEAARSLIDKVIVYPPTTEGEPPTIELVGELKALLDAAAPAPVAAPSRSRDNPVLDMFVSSVKAGPGAQPPAGSRGRAPGLFSGGFMESYQASDRNLALELVRVTEAAALAAWHWVGKGNKIEADGAATEAMRRAFETVAISGVVVIGEGEMDEAPMLYIGEKVGAGGPAMDIAVDPLEGTNLTAKGGPNALTVVALAEHGRFLNAPDIYMEKIGIGGGLPPDLVHLDAPVEENLRNLARAKKVDVSDIVLCTLDRERHADIIGAARGVGARVVLLPDGDVAAIIATTLPNSGVDIFIGTGGAPEGVLSAAALRCTGGQMQGRLNYEDDGQIERARKMGIADPHKIYTIEELAGGNVMFAGTGVTTGAMLRGVSRSGHGAITHSIVMRSKSGTVRYIEGHHDLKTKTWA